MAIATRALFTGAVPDAHPQMSAESLLAAPRGGWTWFNDPRAIYHDGRTFFGWITGAGHVEAAHYDHDTDTVSTPVRLYNPTVPLEVDEHDNPAFWRRPSDGRILAYYGTHTLMDQYVSVSTNPDDASAWGATTAIHSDIGANITTYMNPVAMPDDSVRVFFRDHYIDLDHDPEWAYFDSADGETISGHTSLVRLTYMKAIRGGDRIHFVGSHHPEEHDGTIYHWYWEAGSYYKSDGSSAGSLPLETSDLTVVYDASTTKGWMWDIAMDGEDPVIAYARFPGNDGSDHRAMVARWNGSEWGSTEVAHMGGSLDESLADPFYSGGIAIDRVNPAYIYVSREVAGDWHVFRYPGAVQLTEGAGKQMRPFALDGPFRVFVMAADDYQSYTDWDAGTIAG